MVLEFQPVILAAGEGSRMYPLTEDVPKALLPVGNMPLIWYPIHYLERYGFEEFIIIVQESSLEKFRHSLKTCCNQKLKFDFVTIPDDADMGTAESMRIIKDKIQTDVLVVSCDLITDAPLHRLADIHRSRDAGLTMLLSPTLELSAEKDIKQTGKTKKKDRESVQKDFIGIDKSEGRLLFLANEADLEHDSITIRKSLLKRYPALTIQNDLMDAHFYIIKKWVIDFLVENRSFESFKGDLVPYLIKKQFSQSPQNTSISSNADMSMASLTDGENLDIFSFATEDDLSSKSRYWTLNRDVDKTVIRCYSYVSEGSVCIRVNTLPAYTHLNRQITKILTAVSPNLEITSVHPTATLKEKSQIGNDSLVGESVFVSENVSIKKSVIGKHCTIGQKVKISNTVIMDHVTIKEGSNIQGCIICNNAYIKENCTLKDCQIGAHQTVKEESILKGELIVKEVMDFDD